MTTVPVPAGNATGVSKIIRPPPIWDTGYNWSFRCKLIRTSAEYPMAACWRVMAGIPEDIKRRAIAYGQSRSIYVNLEKELGSGKDGSVFWSLTPSAIKVFASLDP
ncbi:MAG: hypothetical protein JWN51_2754, partial [Phycisphaerales bacterium]|nr:hypothetical protein [Phycisphaerales bacterium]